MITAVAVLSALTKAAGPAVLGKRELPPRLANTIKHIAPALLAALVVTDTIGPNGRYEIDARLAGIAVAAIIYKVKRSLLLCVISAVITTALLRQI